MLQEIALEQICVLKNKHLSRLTITLSKKKKRTKMNKTNDTENQRHRYNWCYFKDNVETLTLIHISMSCIYIFQLSISNVLVL